MTDNVTIIKNGEMQNIDVSKLRIEDIIVLQTGDIAPADIKLTEARGLKVDEFDLTGEITPVGKHADGSNDMLFMGSRIIKGSGVGVVMATGDQTEYGSVLSQPWDQETETKIKLVETRYLFLVLLLMPPLIMQLACLHNPVLVVALYLALSAIFLLLQNTNLIRHFVVMQKISKLKSRNILIRTAEALVIMSGLNVICFDKTGVLTTRQIEVKQVFHPGATLIANGAMALGPLSDLVKLGCALCNDVLLYEKIGQASAYDKALISYAMQNGVDMRRVLSDYKRIHEMPFESENRYMASGFKSDTEAYYFIKGDPEVVLGLCDSYLTETGEKREKSSELVLFVRSITNDIMRQGDTALALAYTPYLSNSDTRDNYSFLCLFRLENTLQNDAEQVVQKIMKAGIRCIILTGDKGETAVKISERCGIISNSKEFINGKAIIRMPLSELALLTDRFSVFARLLPSQKGIIIKLLQRRGNSIAMIGDGPNDGIALKVADVGISFTENSSPIARRYSQILISSLSDIILLRQESKYIKMFLMYFTIIRVVFIAGSLVSLYLWLIRLVIS